MSGRGSFVVSPAKSAGVQPTYVANTSDSPETLHATIAEVGPTGGQCAISRPVHWAHVSQKVITVQPHHTVKVAVKASHVPAGTHDLAIVWTEHNGAVSASVASQEIVGTGPAVNPCATVKRTQHHAVMAAASKPASHDGGSGYLISGLAVVAVLLIVLAIRALKRPKSGGAHAR